MLFDQNVFYHKASVHNFQIYRNMNFGKYRKSGQINVSAIRPSFLEHSNSNSQRLQVFVDRSSTNNNYKSDSQSSNDSAYPMSQPHIDRIEERFINSRQVAAQKEIIDLIHSLSNQVFDQIK